MKTKCRAFLGTVVLCSCLGAMSGRDKTHLQELLGFISGKGNIWCIVHSRSQGWAEGFFLLHSPSGRPPRSQNHSIRLISLGTRLTPLGGPGRGEGPIYR